MNDVEKWRQAVERISPTVEERTARSYVVTRGNRRYGVRTGTTLNGEGAK